MDGTGDEQSANETVLRLAEAKPEPIDVDEICPSSTATIGPREETGELLKEAKPEPVDADEVPPSSAASVGPPTEKTGELMADVKPEPVVDDDEVPPSSAGPTEKERERLDKVASKEQGELVQRGGAVATEALLADVKPEPLDSDELPLPSAPATAGPAEKSDEPNTDSALKKRVAELEAELEKKDRMVKKAAVMIKEKEDEVARLTLLTDSKAATLAVGDTQGFPGGAALLQELNDQIASLKSELDALKNLNVRSQTEKYEAIDAMKKRLEAVERDSACEKEQLEKELATLQRANLFSEQLKSGLQTQVDVFKQEAAMARDRTTKEKEQRQRMEMELAGLKQQMEAGKRSEEEKQEAERRKDAELSDLKQKLKEAEEEKKEAEKSAANLNAQFEQLQQHHKTSLQQMQKEQEPVQKKIKLEDGAAASQQQQQQRSRRSQSRPSAMQQQPSTAATNGQTSSRALRAATRAAAKCGRDTTAVVLEETAHTTNLFAPIRLDAPSVAPLAVATWQMVAAVDTHGREHFLKRCEQAGEIGDLTCGLCDKQQLQHFDIYDHFLSEEHGAKVRAANAGISVPALIHWMRQLQPPRL